MKSSVFIATSLDGYIARTNGAIDWLPTESADGPDEDYGYKKFVYTVDALVMGRNSFETVLGCGIAWPYTKPVIVLSSGKLEIPEAIRGKVEAMSGTPTEVIHRMEERGAKHLYIDGGKTIQGFLAAELIGRMTITRIPILLGSGLPLFGPLSGDVKWRHVETRSWPSGLTQSTYELAS